MCLLHIVTSLPIMLASLSGENEKYTKRRKIGNVTLGLPNVNKTSKFL